MTAPRARPDEDAVIRWLAYVLFFGCALGLVTTLYTAVAPWVGFAAGTATFGGLSAWLFARTMERRSIERARNTAPPSRWRDGDDEDEGA